MRKGPAARHWIRNIEPYELALMGHPRGGDRLADDIDALAEEGVEIVVSLLEAKEMELLALEQEARLCAEADIDFYSFPVPDHGTPASMAAFYEFVDPIADELERGRPAVVHCFAGIGRSGLTAGALLMRLGFPLGSVFALLSSARGCSVPETTEQVIWFRDFARRYASRA